MPITALSALVALLQQLNGHNSRQGKNDSISAAGLQKWSYFYHPSDQVGIFLWEGFLGHLSTWLQNQNLSTWASPPCHVKVWNFYKGNRGEARNRKSGYLTHITADKAKWCSLSAAGLHKALSIVPPPPIADKFPHPTMSPNLLHGGQTLVTLVVNYSAT